MTSERLIGITHAAEMLQQSERWVRKRTDSGDLPCQFTLSGHRLFRWDDVVKLRDADLDKAAAGTSTA